METSTTGDNLLSSAGYFIPALGADNGAVGLGGGGATGAGAFDIDGNMIVRCGLMFGDNWIECADASIDTENVDGVIYATVVHNGGPASLSVHKGTELPESTVDATHRLLYKAVGDAGGGSWADYRSCILVPALS